MFKKYEYNSSYSEYMNNGIKFWRLVKNLTQRDVMNRYQGSLLGVVWTILSPLIMLALYTTVFTLIFRARWPGSDGVMMLGTFDYAIMLFCGLIVHAFMADILSAAPKIILSNKNYVKKVVFPLQALPLVLTGASLFHFFIKFLVLLAFILFSQNTLSLTALYVPLILFPFVLLSLGMAYLFSAIGVYLRDISQITPQLITGLLFIGPILYPTELAPTVMRPLLLFNPLSVPVEQLRGCLVYGQHLDKDLFLVYSAVSLIILLSSYTIFNQLKRGFADVM